MGRKVRWNQKLIQCTEAEVRQSKADEGQGRPGKASSSFDENLNLAALLQARSKLLKGQQQLNWDKKTIATKTVQASDENQTFFSCTVALHLTLVSESLIKWVVVSNSEASELQQGLQACC